MLQPTATCLAGSHHVDKNDDVGRLQCGAGGHQPGTRTKLERRCWWKGMALRFQPEAAPNPYNPIPPCAPGLADVMQYNPSLPGGEGVLISIHTMPRVLIWNPGSILNTKIARQLPNTFNCDGSRCPPLKPQTTVPMGVWHHAN